MPKQEGQKTKLLALLHIFEQKTDENHLLNVPQLVELLENQGILAERKSIYSDFDTLCALGYDIQLRRGRGGGYWTNSLTSLPRSPISAITLISAFVFLANIPSKVLFPTPDPAKIPILCPLPTVIRPSTALTPKGRTSSMIFLAIGSGGCASTG